jgi:hypothetical protein
MLGYSQRIVHTYFTLHRNIKRPLYLPIYRVFHEVFEERLFSNLRRRIGLSMRIVVAKPE